MIGTREDLARERRELPWVPVEEEYEFETPEGTRGLADLFGGRSQLLVYHDHCYSAFDRGTVVLCSSWQLLDGTPRGRPAREELGDWPRRHDEYEEAVHAG